MSETADAIRVVTEATCDEDLFGTADQVRRYRRLAALLHPDRTATSCPDADERAKATAAFVTLTSRWRARGTVPVGAYRLGAVTHTGDIANLYQVGSGLLLKLPRDPANNDLMARESVALRQIADRGDPRYLPYVPRLVDSFRQREAGTGVERRVNVLGTAAHLVSLAEVMRRRPGGLDPRDAAWMWRRLLVALGVAHHAGVVHGAVVPDHVLVEPHAHGVVLVDWCYAVSDYGDRVPALVPQYADWYPPEVHKRRSPGPGTDIAMAARCMTALMGDRAPRALRAFADGCRLPARSARPDDAWLLLAELDDVLERLYGKRTFRPFHL